MFISMVSHTKSFTHKILQLELNLSYFGNVKINLINFNQPKESGLARKSVLIKGNICVTI